jgi:hypothetical protein
VITHLPTRVRTGEGEAAEDLDPVVGEGEYDEVHDRWLVRSPWRPLSAGQAISTLWRWVDQQRRPVPRPLDAYRRSIVEFFALSESEVMAFVTTSGT